MAEYQSILIPKQILTAYMEKVKMTLNATGTTEIPETTNSKDTKITAPEEAQYLGN